MTDGILNEYLLNYEYPKLHIYLVSVVIKGVLSLDENLFLYDIL